MQIAFVSPVNGDVLDGADFDGSATGGEADDADYTGDGSVQSSDDLFNEQLSVG